MLLLYIARYEFSALLKDYTPGTFDSSTNITSWLPVECRRNPEQRATVDHVLQSALYGNLQQRKSSMPEETSSSSRKTVSQAGLLMLR